MALAEEMRLVVQVFVANMELPQEVQGVPAGRYGALGVATHKQYIDYLANNPTEAEKLKRDFADTIDMRIAQHKQERAANTQA